jgi:predicted DNA-binding transcriptional regulator AlpA
LQFLKSKGGFFMSQQNSSVPVLPATGFVRLPLVLKVFPICQSGWYKGVAEGRFPRPIKIGKRVSAYRVEDIRALIECYSNVNPE